ncbi:MAG TPA: outer membrane beta-barrel protein [Telluria sp.]
MFNKIAAAAFLAFVAGSALADDASRFYAGGDIGVLKSEGFAERETGYGAFAGYQINSTFAAEGAYRRLASYRNGWDNMDYSLKVDQFALSVVASAPLSEKTRIYGRLGFARTIHHYHGDIETRLYNSRGLPGVGVAYRFTPTVSGRLELQQPFSETYNLVAGVAFHF